LTKPLAVSAPKSPTKKSRQATQGPRSVAVLTSKQRRYLRGLAHGMLPILQIGKAGPSKALLDELDRALLAHELVKIRMLRECPTELAELLGLAESSLGTSTVGSVGKVAILYRARSDKPRITLPDKATQPRPATKATKPRPATKATKPFNPSRRRPPSENQ
jgi:RNA-binding protein